MTTASNFISKLTHPTACSLCLSGNTSPANVGNARGRKEGQRRPSSAAYLGRLLRTFESAPSQLEVSGIKKGEKR